MREKQKTKYFYRRTIGFDNPFEMAGEKRLNVYL